MKLGEIKLQALMLIFPFDVIEYNEEAMEELIYNLRGSTAYSPYLSASVGAINRAFSSIEQKMLSGKSCLELDIKNSTRHGEYRTLDLSSYEEILKINDVYLDGESVDFYMLTDSLLNVKCQRGQGKILITYLKRLKRINFATSNSYEIQLGGIEEAIPYFIKSDLLLGERPDEATVARNIYEGMLEEYLAKNGDKAIFQTVYSIGRL